MINVAFYDIFYLRLYYWQVDRELPRNFRVDPCRRQVGHPCHKRWSTITSTYSVCNFL